MAAEMGVSEATVRRIWHANGLKPHLVETLQGQQRQEVRRETGSHRRALSESAGTCDRAVRG